MSNRRTFGFCADSPSELAQYVENELARHRVKKIEHVAYSTSVFSLDLGESGIEYSALVFVELLPSAQLDVQEHTRCRACGFELGSDVEIDAGYCTAHLPTTRGAR